MNGNEWQQIFFCSLGSEDIINLLMTTQKRTQIHKFRANPQIFHWFFHPMLAFSAVVLCSELPVKCCSLFRRADLMSVQTLIAKCNSNSVYAIIDVMLGYISSDCLFVCQPFCLCLSDWVTPLKHPNYIAFIHCQWLHNHFCSAQPQHSQSDGDRHPKATYVWYRADSVCQLCSWAQIWVLARLRHQITNVFI